jgi:hypothetical protein
MSSTRLIRADEFGLYVLTGGYAFRPVDVAERHFFPANPRYAGVASGLPSAPSKLAAGDKVLATHRGASTQASVGGETWVSSSNDPRYPHY